MTAVARHGHARAGATTPEYVLWANMKSRCGDPKDPSFDYYGGRGVTVCARWRDSFEAFLDDVGRRTTPAHSLDRIENARGYEPGNVRWATRKEQMRNTRASRVLEHKGKSLSIAEWAERTGLAYGTLYMRIASGWPVAEALTVSSSKSNRSTPRGSRAAKGDARGRS